MHITKIDSENINASYLKYKICISGAAEIEHAPAGTVEKAIEVGRLVAEHGMVLMTGATTGIPYWAAKGAKEAGGIVIGLSPAVSKISHLKTYHLPIDYHDLIIYTGFDYSGRNLLLTRSSDAVITLYGRIGTLNEFTIAFEEKKPRECLRARAVQATNCIAFLKYHTAEWGKLFLTPIQKRSLKK